MRRLSLSLSSPSFTSSLIKPLVVVHNPLCYKLVKKYSKYERDEKILDKERAPSTAEIMDELTQEMEDNERILAEKSEQGFVSQTSDKLLDAATEAISSDVDSEDVKEIYKEGSPGQTYHKPTD